MNTEKLLAAKANILKHPSQFVMHSYFSKLNSLEKPATGCGTASCIAGWVIANEYKDKTLKEVASDDWRILIEPSHRAVQILDINYPESYRLFNLSNWPAEFQEAWDAAKTAKQKAKVAAERIDFFIKTNGKDNIEND